VAGVLGELGDPSPHAEASVPRAAQQPAQNCRRDTTMLVSDIAILVTGGPSYSSCRFGKIEAHGFATEAACKACELCESVGVDE